MGTDILKPICWSTCSVHVQCICIVDIVVTSSCMCSGQIDDKRVPRETIAAITVTVTIYIPEYRLISMGFVELVLHQLGLSLLISVVMVYETVCCSTCTVLCYTCIITGSNNCS